MFTKTKWFHVSAGQRSRWARFIFIAVVSVGIFTLFAPPNAQAFEILDELSYLDKPDLSPYGVVKKSRMVYEQSLWLPGEDRTQLPQQSVVQDFIASNYADYSDILIIDIESMALKTSGDIETHLDTYVTIMQWIAEAAPLARLSLYGKPPSPDPSKASSDPSSSSYQTWQSWNDLYTPLTAELDVLSPQNYTLTTDQTFWYNTTRGYIAESRRIAPGKPVYIFMQPVYNPANAQPPELRSTPIPYDYWYFQLQSAKDLGADGVVFWRVAKTTPWDENAEWWQATKDFLAANPPVDTEAPSIPAALTATALSASQIDLVWQASTDDTGVTGYRVERCTGSACTDFTEIAAPAGTSLSNTGLAAGTT
ncbi:MAG: hypothetical protein L0Y32_03340, partial [Nevskiales bacterium]|nr:hypothetical protein [Nevskiales bacterium]